MKKQLIKKYLDYGLSQKAQIEIYYQESQEEQIDVCHQKIEKSSAAIDRGLAIRVIKDQRTGFSYTTSLKEADIIKTIDNAIASATYTASDKYQKLPAKKIIKNNQRLALYDKNIAQMTTAEKIALAKKTEKSAYAQDSKIKNTETATFSTTVTSNLLANSNGVFFQEKQTICGASIEIIAKSGKKMEAGFDYQYSTNLRNLNCTKIGSTAAHNALTMLTAQSIPTGKYELLLPPNAAISFLSVIVPMFFADNIQKNKSLLKGKLNQTIASPLVTLIDDPFIVGGFGSYLYDAEGVPGQKKTMVQNGILKNYLYDTYTANKAGVTSTGNASRYSLKTEPGIGGSNFYLQPSKNKNSNLINNIASGIKIKSLIGLHTADPISGQFSLGATGELIENGKTQHAVKNIAIAGNLLELLNNISAVGDDLMFRPDSGALGAPSLVIENIQVAGE